jgi:hypothetical protein
MLRGALARAAHGWRLRFSRGDWLVPGASLALRVAARDGAGSIHGRSADSPRLPAQRSAPQLRQPRLSVRI